MMGDMTDYAREPPRGVTFEDAWAVIQETGRRIQETERLIKELTEKTDQQMKETDRQMKETDRRLGKLGIRLGDVVEHLMSPSLHEKFEGLGFCFTRSSQNIEIRDQNKQGLAEVDVLLEDGEYAMAVEVKTHLTSRDVKDHVKRMGVLRRVADERQEGRKYLGAVAGAVVSPEAAAYAIKNGFYVIVPSGETVEIKVPEGFKPRIW
jgi:hypothetical protein